MHDGDKYGDDGANGALTQHLRALDQISDTAHQAIEAGADPAAAVAAAASKRSSSATTRKRSPKTDTAVAAGGGQSPSAEAAVTDDELDLDAAMRAYAVVAAFGERVQARGNSLRRRITELWINDPSQRANKTRTVTLPGAHAPVASATVIDPKPTVRVDDAVAFTDAVEGRSPEDVMYSVTVRFPASVFGAKDTRDAIAAAARRLTGDDPNVTVETGRTVRDSYAAALLKPAACVQTITAVDDGKVTTSLAAQWPDLKTGEFVDIPGVVVTPPADPTSFRFVEAKDGGSVLATIAESAAAAALDKGIRAVTSRG